MKKVILKENKQILFLKEISLLNFNEKIIFELNKNIVNNFQILIKFLITKKIKKLKLTNYTNLENEDLIKFKSDLRKYYLSYTKYINIVFPKCNHIELEHLLKERNYLNYCKINNLPPQWESFKETQIQKIKENKDLLKYYTFKILSEKIKEMPFSNLNYPKEENIERFVFYSYIYSQESQIKFLNLINELNLNNNLLMKIINENKINEEIFYFGIGFSYIQNQLNRLTLYGTFANDKIKENSNLKKYFKSKVNLNLTSEVKNILYYGIDFYENNKIEIKIYDSPYKFNEKLLNLEIKKILENKICTKVLKYHNDKIIAIKYEFDFGKKEFGNKDKEILKKYNLYNNKTKILAIYINKGEIVKKVLYEV